MTPFEKLKLPPNFEVVTAAEFLAALQPSQNIRRIRSEIGCIMTQRAAPKLVKLPDPIPKIGIFRSSA